MTNMDEKKGLSMGQAFFLFRGIFFFVFSILFPPTRGGACVGHSGGDAETWEDIFL